MINEITKLLPYSLMQDPVLVAMFEAAAIQLREAYEEAEVVYNLVDVDKMPEILLDLIAFEKHVDFYDNDLSIEQKRDLVQRSISWHRKKGTRAAIENVVSIVYPNAEVYEWFEYDGEPYRFIIELDQPFVYDKDMSRLKRMVSATKNLRSWLEYIVVRFGKKELNLGQLQWHYPVLYPIAGYHWTEGIKGATFESDVSLQSDPYKYPVLYPITNAHEVDGVKGSGMDTKNVNIVHMVAAAINPYPVCGEFYGGGY